MLLKEDSSVDFHLMQVCGEYKESEILRLGFFASQLAPVGYSHVQSESINRHEGCYMLINCVSS